LLGEGPGGCGTRCTGPCGLPADFLPPARLGAYHTCTASDRGHPGACRYQARWASNSLMPSHQSLRLAPAGWSCSAPSVWDPAQRLLLLADLHLRARPETFAGPRHPPGASGDRAPQCPSGSGPPLAPPGGGWSSRDLIPQPPRLQPRGLRQKLAALPGPLLGCPLNLIGGNHETGAAWLRGPEPTSQPPTPGPLC